MRPNGANTRLSCGSVTSVGSCPTNSLRRHPAASNLVAAAADDNPLLHLLLLLLLLQHTRPAPGLVERLCRYNLHSAGSLGWPFSVC